MYESYYQLPVLFTYNGKLINDNKNNRKFDINNNAAIGAYNAICINQGYATLSESKYNLQKNTLNAYGKFGIIAEYYYTFIPKNDKNVGYLLGLRFSGDLKGSAYSIRNTTLQTFDKFTNIGLFCGITF